MGKVWDDVQKCYVSDVTVAPEFSEPVVSASVGPDSTWTKKKLTDYCDENNDLLSTRLTLKEYKDLYMWWLLGIFNKREWVNNE